MFRFLIFLIFLVLVSHCARVDPVTGEKILEETDTRKKSREFVDKQGGLFGEIGKNKSGTTFDFATSNILWRATLKSLDFLPLVNADYSGGVIIYDWYSENLNSKEQIKVSIRFLSNELRSESMQISSHKKICDENNKCSISKLSENFSNEIRDTILLTARNIKIEEAKKEKQ
jgi:hypothetical protein